MEPEGMNATPTSNVLLVYPFVCEPSAQNQCTLPPQSRLPQFSETSARILNRIKGNGATQHKISADGQLDASKSNDSSVDELTLLLPGDVSRSLSAAQLEYVYKNDDSFETTGVNFAQESIPFRPPHKPIEVDDAVTVAPAEPTREEAIDVQRQAWLGTLPDGVLPAKPELVGFPAGPEASASTLTSYFYGKSKTDLLNILSFADQLEPQLLVDLFVSVSKRHPKLPLFDAPDWETKVREKEAARAVALAAAQARARAHQRPRHGHTLLNPRMRQKRNGVRKVVKITTTTTEAAGKTVVVQEEESEEEELLPPTWRKAGEGLYAMLPPEDEDTLYLADEALVDNERSSVQLKIDSQLMSQQAQIEKKQSDAAIT
ncbi:hypothetical protein LMH87_004626 [Akanthomyces muscarius]|uniref:Uncharacterized protein n=1 Tax=Akanthomyces muscarius TaxID=2231603 RepID=A0A9W8Q438_AKAMU|nr:hypothetical protein LMH87_004626 [Akanthomyces muscarius]KAJ4145790.1 hypothetical protein LMH87_004626 [Akanthomyces muscarius]